MSVLLAYQNRIDEATLSGGNWHSSLPLANLQERALQRVARSLDASGNSTQFIIDLTRTRSIGVLALVNHNLSPDATWTLTGSNNADLSNPLYSYSGDLWSSVHRSLDLEWEDSNFWSGKPTLEELDGYTWSAYHLLTPATSARYWRVTLADPYNAAGYVQLGRVFIGAGWSPSYDLAPGASLGYASETTVNTALSGTEYFERREGYRIARFGLRGLQKDEALSQGLDLQRIAGTDEEIWFSYDSNDRATLHSLRRTFLGRLRQLNAIEQPYANFYQTQFEIQELR